MKIQCLDPLGISGYEREANERLEATLPNNWKGYSSLEMRGRQSGEFEGDLILVTHDRIINVEFKKWSGKIFSKNGLVLSPRKSNFQYPDQYRNDNKTIEIVIPVVYVNKLMLKVIPITRIRIFNNV